MQVIVNVKVQTNASVKAASIVASNAFAFTVNANDTVVALKERIASSQSIPFPERDLIFDSKVLTDNCRVLDCGFKNGINLDFVVKASEGVLVKQLSQLLEASTTSTSFVELAHHYSYKYGISVANAMKLSGVNEKSFEAFLKRQKKIFIVDEMCGSVGLATPQEEKKPQSLNVVEELASILEASPTGSMHITALSDKFVQKCGVSIKSVANQRPTDILAREVDLFVLNGRGYVCLKSREHENPASVPPSGTAPKSEKKKGASVKTATATTTTTTTTPPTISEASTSADEAEEVSPDQHYLDLHSRICGHSSCTRSLQALKELEQLIEVTTFLSIHHIAMGGSLVKDTAINGVTDAEMVLFLDGLPPMCQVLPGLLQVVASSLQEHLGSGERDVRVDGDCIRLCTKDLPSVRIRLSPVHDSYEDLVEMGHAEGPDTCRLFKASLTPERAQFIQWQPEEVKITIRLLKWWREQQHWSSARTRPSDEILELLAVYSFERSHPRDQCSAVDAVIALMARFEDLRIFWPAYHYNYAEIDEDIKEQKPVLMDPTNPFVNVADAQVFDPRELQKAALATHFFW